MRKFLLCFLISLSCTAQEKQNILALGNFGKVCGIDSLFTLSSTLPKKLDSFQTIFLFSNAESTLTSSDMSRIFHFVEKGGGLYCGAENWPLQAESNTFTEVAYNKKSFGNYSNTRAESASSSVNLSLDTLAYIPAGNTTVAFPMDYRLTVEAWVEDNPLILSGKIGNGHIIIDGGYSRFYCEFRNEITDQMLHSFLVYLKNSR